MYGPGLLASPIRLHDPNAMSANDPLDVDVVNPRNRLPYPKKGQGPGFGRRPAGGGGTGCETTKVRGVACPLIPLALRFSPTHGASSGFTLQGTA